MNTRNISQAGQDVDVNDAVGNGDAGENNQVVASSVLTTGEENHVFESLWQQTSSMNGPRVVKRGKSPAGNRAILIRTFGMRRAAIIEHNREPGFLIQLLDGKGSNELVGDDGIIKFPRLIHGTNLRSLLSALDAWLEACNLIYGLTPELARQHRVASVPPDEGSVPGGRREVSQMTVADHARDVADQSHVTEHGRISMSEEWVRGDHAVKVQPERMNAHE